MTDPSGSGETEAPSSMPQTGPSVPSAPATTILPPDPEAYDSPRAELARARGLQAPYIAGGRDPDPAKGRREERFYGRLLIAMVLVIALGAFVLGFLIDFAGNLGH